MASYEERNIISKKCGDFSIEWTIKDFLTFMERETFYCDSPLFWTPCSRYQLEIKLGIGDQIRLNIYRFDGDPLHDPKCNDANIGIKKADGTIEIIPFKDDSSVTLDKSTFLQRRSELAPSGSLTIVCTFKGCVPCLSRLVNLSNDIEEMYRSSNLKDVTLIARKKEFQVNKSVLSARCPGFQEKFSNSEDSSVIYVGDHKDNAFSHYLWYIYTGRVGSAHIFELYEIADEYKNEKLKEDILLCAATTLELSVDNFNIIAVSAHKFSEKNPAYEEIDVTPLKSKIKDFFLKNYAEIIEDDQWTLFMKKHLDIADELLKYMASKITEQRERVAEEDLQKAE